MALKELTLEATIEHVLQATEFVNEQLDAVGCELKAKRIIDIVIDEVFSNIANYAYAPQTGMVTVRVEVQEAPRAVEITFIDAGVPFNPLAQEDPDIGLPTKERKIGGLGIFIVKKSMDDVRYAHIDGCNVTTIRKVLG